MNYASMDRVFETWVGTGTGIMTLAGAKSGYQSFAGAFGADAPVYYCIEDLTNGAWEVGMGNFVLSGTTLARTLVLASSNAGALVNFASGTKNVFSPAPAALQNLISGGYGSAALSYGGFDPNAAGTGWSLSNGNRYGVNSSAVSTTTLSKQAFKDKRYFEAWTRTYTNSNNPVSGIGVSSVSPAGHLGYGASDRDLGYYSSNFCNYSAGGGAATTGATWNVDSCAMIAMDVPNQKVWVGVNGIWCNGGDPASGTSPIHTFATGAATYWFGIANNSGNANPVQMEGHFRAQDCWWSIPAGFAALDGGTQNFAGGGGNPVGYGAHRYWRLLFTGRGSTTTSICECEFRPRATGTLGIEQTCTGGTASASSSGGGPASGAFDGSFSTGSRWYSAGNATEWLMYDWGAGNAKNIVEVGVNSTVGAGQDPSNYAIQFSDDNVTWTTARTVASMTVNGAGAFGISRLDPAYGP